MHLTGFNGKNSKLKIQILNNTYFRLKERKKKNSISKIKINKKQEEKSANKTTVQKIPYS